MESTTTPARSPARGYGATVPRGIDPASARPGVPMEAGEAGRPVTTGAHWDTPPRQEGAEHRLRRAGLDRATPVFGTAQPPRGLSGMIRRGAYTIPEHFARHWMLLMFADRIDVLEDRVGSAIAEPLDRLGIHAGADYARRNPLGVLAGAVVGAWVVKKLL